VHLIPTHVDACLLGSLLGVQAAGWSLLVSGKVEGDEEDEVAGEDGHARGGRQIASLAAMLGVWENIGKVLWDKDVICCKVDEDEIDDELGDLEESDVFLPPDLDAARGLEVVPVHEAVHGQVEGNGHPRDWGGTGELDVAEESSGTMVVGVQEGQGLFLEEEEAGVNEFDVFGQVVKLGG
jgi:hypothetical protein